MAANFGGYDYSFVDKILDRFTCEAICTKVLKNPHLTVCCGQHFCESCLCNWFTKHLKESTTPRCPHCQAEGKKFQHFLNKSLKREIDSLRIYCTNKKQGCQWIGELGSLKHHLESANGCDYVQVERCPNGCMDSDPISLKSRQTINVKKMQRKALKIHLKNECHLRPYRCEHCGHKDTYYRITGKHPYKSSQPSIYHYTKCHEYPLNCPNKCGSNLIKRKNMKDHRSRCPKEPVQCPFEDAGCKEKLVRGELEKHMSATQQQHLLIVMGAYKEMKKENRRLKHKLEDAEDDLDDLKRRMDQKQKRTEDN